MFKFLNINRCQAIGLQIALETANLRKKTTRVWWYAALWLKEINSRVTPTHETFTARSSPYLKPKFDYFKTMQSSLSYHHAM